MNRNKKIGIPANKEGNEGDIVVRRDTNSKTSIFGKINGIWERVGLDVLGSPPSGSFAFFKGPNKIHHDSRFGIRNGVASFNANVTTTGDFIATGPTSELAIVTTESGSDTGIQFSNTPDNANWNIATDGDDSHKLKIDKHWIAGTDTKLTIDNDGNVGIGVSSPSQKLSILGNIILNEDEETKGFIHGNNALAISSDSDI